MTRLPRRLSDFGVLTEAEQAVIAGLESGHVTALGEDVPDPDAGADRRVRASLVRWLALGAPGAAKIRLHEHGLRIMGALIVSDGTADPAFWGERTLGLDLEGCTLPHGLLLLICRFEHAPFLRNAQVQTLNLALSHLPGLTADGLKAAGSVSLRQVVSEGEVRLHGARIGGDLGCDGGSFETNDADKALNAQGARVTGTFFWRPDDQGQKASVSGELDLSAAEIGDLCDDPACWPARKGDLVLNRCRYGAFTGRGISAAERIRWLTLQDPAKFGQDFWPQPWEQCAKVLREMGHPEDAREILIEKERLQRADRLRRIESRVARRLSRASDGFLGATIAYGHRPMLAAAWLGGLWVVMFLAFGMAWRMDAFKPNDPFILRGAEWVRCGAEADASLTLAATGAQGESLQVTGLRRQGETRAACLMRQPDGRGYPDFNAGIYAADLLVPLVDLGQQDRWVPDERGQRGWLAKALVYASIVAGWGLSLLAVAGFSGLVKSD